MGCRLTAVDPPALLAFEWKSPKQFKSFANAADPLTHVVVLFFPSSRGTNVHLMHSGWRSFLEWRQAADSQLRAWSLALKRLEEKINTGVA
jgi:uncharacterized protein YndB with AHSA1/START domain